MARIRSPNYPQIELEEAINLTKKIFDKEAQNFAPRDVVAELLGYTSVNGASEKKVSAITAYGLLDRNSDRELKVSDLAMRIMHPEDHHEKAQALEEAALSPNLFREIIEKWPEKLPSDENLRSFLIRRGFNQNAVGQVILSFRSAMSFVNVKEAEKAPELGDIELADDEQPLIEVDRKHMPEVALVHNKPIVFDMETVSGQYSFANSEDLASFIVKLEKILPLLPSKTK